MLALHILIGLLLATLITLVGLVALRWNLPEWQLLVLATTPIVASLMTATVQNHFTSRRESQVKQREFEHTRLALLHELSSRVAHCAFDYERPWREYGDIDVQKERKLNGVIKFKPIDPVIYPVASATVGKLSTKSASAIIHFYDALARWKREIEDAEHSTYLREWGEGITYPTVPVAAMRQISRRLGETLQPGSSALSALADEIGDDAWPIIKRHFELYYGLANDERSLRLNDIDPKMILAELSSAAIDLKLKEFTRKRQKNSA